MLLIRYVTAGTAWLNGAFSKVARAGQAAGTKTREKFHLAVSNLTAKVGVLQLTRHFLKVDLVTYDAIVKNDSLYFIKTLYLYYLEVLKNRIFNHLIGVKRNICYAFG